jgi:hypothetical protein
VRLTVRCGEVFVIEPLIECLYCLWDLFLLFLLWLFFTINIFYFRKLISSCRLLGDSVSFQQHV